MRALFGQRDESAIIGYVLDCLGELTDCAGMTDVPHRSHEILARLTMIHLDSPAGLGTWM